MTVFQYFTAEQHPCVHVEFQPCQRRARAVQEGGGLSWVGSSHKPHSENLPQMLVPLLLQYLETLSGQVDSNLNCGPVLTWMEVGPGRGLGVGSEGGMSEEQEAAWEGVWAQERKEPEWRRHWYFSICVGACL